MVVGPDAYKRFTNLLAEVEEGRDAINVILSKRRNAMVILLPVRLNSNGVNAFVSITRGCDNMCTFCVVPFTVVVNVVVNHKVIMMKSKICTIEVTKKLLCWDKT